jgi:predicted enzyme related to lactoylglutathione lyase
MDTCRIEWITIPAPDLEAAKSFYSEVFGFELAPFSDRFVVFKCGNLSGGLDQDLQPSPSGIGFSITVPSMREYLERIRRFGCEVIRESYELGPGRGFCCRFRDPNGNCLELYSPAD